MANSVSAANTHILSDPFQHFHTFQPDFLRPAPVFLLKTGSSRCWNPLLLCMQWAECACESTSSQGQPLANEWFGWKSVNTLKLPHLFAGIILRVHFSPSTSRGIKLQSPTEVADLITTSYWLHLFPVSLPPKSPHLPNILHVLNSCLRICSRVEEEADLQDGILELDGILPLARW